MKRLTLFFYLLTGEMAEQSSRSLGSGSFEKTNTLFYLLTGEMAERSNAAVLKTVEGHTSGGSNPSFSAKGKPATKVVGFFMYWK